MQEIVFSPADFIAALNQTLEFAYPLVIVEGELSNFRVSKNRWVYFDLKDEQASVPFFGTVYSLPGPLEDGMVVRVVGAPRMHARFGFSVNFESILPVGEGALKKAADLLFKKLSAEGLFALERKRPLPEFTQSIGLITAASSAAAADFVKVLGERWGGVEVFLYDVYVQGEQSPPQLVQAIEHFNKSSSLPEVLVITRGGGSAEDLAAFNDERVVRAVAASRIPTLVAIGHEVDISMAELAADQRASTPSNAAQLLTPDKKYLLQNLQATQNGLAQAFKILAESQKQALKHHIENLDKHIFNLLAQYRDRLLTHRRLVQLFDPSAMLKRGYAIARAEGKLVKSVNQVKLGQRLDVKLADGKIESTVNKVLKNAQES